MINAPNSQTGPYVVVAVDNHFHDIHPSDPPTITADRPFVVKNEGFNLHNFSVVGTPHQHRSAARDSRSPGPGSAPT